MKETYITIYKQKKNPNHYGSTVCAGRISKAIQSENVAQRNIKININVKIIYDHERRMFIPSFGWWSQSRPWQMVLGRNLCVYHHRYISIQKEVDQKSLFVRKVDNI